MSRLSKKIKKYERPLLLAIVVILLATFSVTGAIKCAGGGSGGRDADYGGTFRVGRTDTETLSSQDFLVWQERFFRRGSRALQAPTLTYAEYVKPFHWATPALATWAHVLAVECAKQARFHVGDGQVGTAIKQIVRTAMQLEFSDALYQKFLREWFRGRQGDLEELVREVLLADMVREPAVESARHLLTYEGAIEEWKPQRERVDLRYVALAADPFEGKVKEVEATRTTMAQQESLLLNLVTAARQIRPLRDFAQSAAAKPNGVLPADLKALNEAMGATSTTEDPWKKPMGYVLKDGKPWPFSAGPDGKEDTADDVTPETLRVVQSHGALREVADALQTWFAATKAWPDSLARLKERPGENQMPPLKRDVKDGWEKDLIYVAGSEGKPPRLLSTGPDGQGDTADDLTAEFSTDATAGSIRIPAAPALAPFLLADLRDAWGHALRVHAKPEGWGYEVVSPGPDGQFGTADDVVGGNEIDQRTFFQKPEVKADFNVPIRRTFAAVVLHLGLVPDDVFRKLWNAPEFEKFRQTETDAYQVWRLNRADIYTAEDPRDPEKGHGAALAKKLAPGAPTFLVPDKSIFGEAPADLAKDDPSRKDYLEKGWREVLLREYFFEKLLADHLKRAIESRDEVKKWQDKVDRKKEAGEKPEEVTLESLLEKTLKPYLPESGSTPFLVLVKPGKPLSRTEWEALPDLADVNLTVQVSSVVGPGQYATIPIPLNTRQSRVLYENLTYEGERPREFEEVRADPAFLDRYLATRRLQRAKKELEALRALIEKKEGAAEGDAHKAAFGEAVEEWAKALGVPYTLATTGTFVGSHPPGAMGVPAGATPEEILKLHGRDFVRQTGYSTVRPAVTPDAAPTFTSVGAFGREILLDERTGDNATKSAYLVRVASQAPPAAEEFSPSDYVGIVIQRFFGDLIRGSRNLAPQVHKRHGTLSETLGNFLDNPAWLQSKFELKTKTDLTQPAVIDR